MQRRALLAHLATTGVVATGLASAAAATNDGYEPLGHVDLDIACEAVVGDDGETAYVATYDGFATVDIGDPEEPTVLAERDDLLADADLEFSGILDVKISGNRLAVVGPGNEDRTGELFEGFVLYDVSDPADPERVTDPYETGYHIHNCFLDGETLYLVANDFERNPLTIFDVSDDDPEEIGRWSLLEHEDDWGEVDPILWYLHDVYVRDDLAFLAYWNAGTYVLDVSDPTTPNYVSHVAQTTLEENREVEPAAVSDYQLGLPGNDHYSAVDETGTILAVNREAWVSDAPEADRPGGIDIFDLSDPADPVMTASIEAPEAPDMSYQGGQWTTSHNFEIRDGWLYTSWYQGGVKIFDLADLEAPEEITSWRDPHTAGFWTARVAHDGGAYVASSTPIIPNADVQGGLYVFASEAGQQIEPPAFEGATEDDSSDDAASAGEDDEDRNGGADDVAGDDGEDTQDDTAEAIPGFTGPAAAVAGGALVLEARRRLVSDDDGG